MVAEPDLHPSTNAFLKYKNFGLVGTSNAQNRLKSRIHSGTAIYKR